MSRTVAFRQTDLVRALRGADKAGMSVSRIEIDPTGKIVMVMASPSAEPQEGTANEWDVVLCP